VGDLSSGRVRRCNIQCSRLRDSLARSLARRRPAVVSWSRDYLDTTTVERPLVPRYIDYWSGNRGYFWREPTIPENALLFCKPCFSERAWVYTGRWEIRATHFATRPPRLCPVKYENPGLSQKDPIAILPLEGRRWSRVFLLTLGIRVSDIFSIMLWKIVYDKRVSHKLCRIVT